MKGGIDRLFNCDKSKARKGWKLKIKKKYLIQKPGKTKLERKIRKQQKILTFLIKSIRIQNNSIDSRFTVLLNFTY